MRTYIESSYDGVVFHSTTKLLNKLREGTRYHLTAGKTITDDSALKFEAGVVFHNGTVDDINEFTGIYLFEETTRAWYNHPLLLQGEGFVLCHIDLIRDDNRIRAIVAVVKYNPRYQICTTNDGFAFDPDELAPVDFSTKDYEKAIAFSNILNVKR